MCSSGNSEDPDKMPHYAAFHQGLFGKAKEIYNFFF